MKILLGWAIIPSILTMTDAFDTASTPALIHTVLSAYGHFTSMMSGSKFLDDWNTSGNRYQAVWECRYTMTQILPGLV